MKVVVILFILQALLIRGEDVVVAFHAEYDFKALDEEGVFSFTKGDDIVPDTKLLKELLVIIEKPKIVDLVLGKSDGDFLMVINSKSYRIGLVDANREKRISFIFVEKKGERYDSVPNVSSKHVIVSQKMYERLKKMMAENK